MQRTVLIDERSRSNVLRCRGRIVFPVRDGALHQRIEALALEAGVSTRSVRAEPADLEPGKRGGKVGYLGEDLKPTAQLYAHLTGRGGVCSLGDLTADSEIQGLLDDVEVLVTLTSQLTAELLELLFDIHLESRVERGKAARRTPGLICASNLNSLMTRAVMTAAALQIGPPPAPSQLELGLAGAMISTKSTHRDLDPTPDRADVRKALKEGATLLRLHSHCDGIDALLLKDLTLCPRQLPAPPTDPETGPYCASTGFCHRQGMPVTEAEQEDRLVSPNAVSGRVLMLSTCQGAIPDNTVIGREWALIDSLLDSLSVTAVVTTWEACIPPADSIAEAAGRLLGGATVGETVARFNRGEVARRFGCRLALFGDPRLTVARRSGGSQIPQTKAARERVPRPQLADVGFLRAYLAMSLADLPERLAGEMQTAQQALAKYEYYIWRGAPLEGPQGPGRELREAMLGFVARRGSSPFHAWTALACEISDESGPICDQCGQRTRLTTMGLRMATEYRRLMVRCPVCGIIAEGPTDMDLRLAIDEGQISLSGTLPIENWAGVLHIACQREEESIAFPWPTDAKGRPGQLSMPQEHLPPGPLRIAAVLIQEATLSVASIPFRKELTCSLNPSPREEGP